MFKSYGITYELIFVDDGSKDDSASVLKILSHESQQVKAIILSNNAGQQIATKIGLQYATMTYSVTIDDDLSIQPNSILLLLEEIKKGYKVVYGYIETRHQTLWRRFGTLVKELLFFLMVKKPAHVRLTSFRMMDKDTKDYVVSDPNHKVYISGRILNYTKNIQSIPVSKLTLGGLSSYDLYSLIKLCGTITQYYDRRFCKRLFSKKKESYSHSLNYIKEIYQ